jgi:deoxyribose-phosphate aldolase
MSRRGWTKKDVASLIDYSLLKPSLTFDDIRRMCREAADFGFYAVTVNPCHTALSASSVKGTSVKVCTVVSFPFGLSKTELKVVEAVKAVEEGATEIDFVLNISAERSHDFGYVYRDAKAVVEAVKRSREDVIVKAILENAYLTDEEKVRSCQACVTAGVDFVKTSTGYAPGGATIEDVALMRRTVGQKVGVKAAGGIKDFDTFVRLVEAGANRIGTSHGIEILKDIP